jgi:hypothetical protein
MLNSAVYYSLGLPPDRLKELTIELTAAVETELLKTH